MSEQISDDPADLELPEAQDVSVERSPGQVVRLVASLIGAGVGAGLIVALAVWFFGGIAQTEAGLCRVTWVPCTSLSVSTIEQLAGVELPEGTEVVSGYAHELGANTTFLAEVVLPAGAESPLPDSYSRLDGAWPDIVPAATERGLTGVSYWWIDPGNPFDSIGAAEGVDASGKTVLLFDTRITG